MENKTIDIQAEQYKRNFIREHGIDKAVKQAMFDIYIKQYEEKMKKEQEKKNVW